MCKSAQRVASVWTFRWSSANAIPPAVCASTEHPISNFLYMRISVELHWDIVIRGRTRNSNVDQSSVRTMANSLSRSQSAESEFVWPLTIQRLIRFEPSFGQQFDQQFGQQFSASSSHASKLIRSHFACDYKRFVYIFYFDFFSIRSDLFSNFFHGSLRCSLVFGRVFCPLESLTTVINGLPSVCRLKKDNGDNNNASNDLRLPDVYWQATSSNLLR